MNVYAVMSKLMKAFARVFCSLAPQSFSMSYHIEHIYFLMEAELLITDSALCLVVTFSVSIALAQFIT